MYILNNEYYFYICRNKQQRDMERFSMKQVMKDKYGEVEKSKSGKVATKRAAKNVEKSDSKYTVKIVDGVKYMVLK